MYRPAVRRRAPGELDTFLFADYSGAASCLWAPRADLATALDLTRVPAPVRRAARLEGWILGPPAAAPKQEGGAWRTTGAIERRNRRPS